MVRGADYDRAYSIGTDMSVLLITGGRTFCEKRPGADHMSERIALGFALDYIAPSSVIVGDADGADRWAKIWADKRGVSLSTERPDYAVVFPGGRIPGGVEIYRGTVK